MAGLMDGSSSFPSRPEMERGLAGFAERAAVRARYGCQWQSTRRDDDRFVLETTDGEYRCRLAVFAVGVAEPWRPPIPGLEKVPHYGECGNPEAYAGKRVFIIGKQNSGFEIASGLLAWAGTIVLASPSPTKLSVNTRTLVGVRARYVQPYEDHVLAGGVLVLDAAIEGVSKRGHSYLVETRSSVDGSPRHFEVDAVIVATGFVAPLQDLPALGVATFGQSRLPAQTAYWESASLPGIFFAGTLSQGAAGLRKHGVPSNSGAVHGHRYNARLLARHIAERHFGLKPEGRPVAEAEVVDYLLSELSSAPELWHQKSYLARALLLQADGRLSDTGIVPLSAFIDAAGPDGLAVAIETNAHGDTYPAIYRRQRGMISEHLLDPNPIHDYRTDEHRRALAGVLEPLLGAVATTG
jgi:thioredoxin reductase